MPRLPPGTSAEPPAPGLVPDLELLCAQSGGVLARAQLVAQGLSARDVARLVRDGVLVRVHRDAYRVPDGPESPQRAFLATVQAVRRRHPSVVLMGSAAVASLGLPVFGRPTAVHVASGSASQNSARSVFRVVAAAPPDQLRRTTTGLVAGPARAALDVARLDGLVAGVVAADAALRAGSTTAEELDAVVRTLGGRRGVARARLCADLASPLSESPGESWSAVVLHQHGIARPERQHVVVDERGVVGRVDFFWPDAGVVGEFDGRVKYGRSNPSGRPPEDVLWEEKLREDRLRAAGLAPVRWVTADLRSPAAWLARLRRALDGPPTTSNGAFTRRHDAG